MMARRDSGGVEMCFPTTDEERWRRKASNIKGTAGTLINHTGRLSKAILIGGVTIYISLRLDAVRVHP